MSKTVTLQKLVLMTLLFARIVLRMVSLLTIFLSGWKLWTLLDLNIAGSMRPLQLSIREPELTGLVYAGNTTPWWRFWALLEVLLQII